MPLLPTPFFLWFDNSRICACYGAFCTHHEDVVSRGRFAFRRLFHCQRRHAFHHFLAYSMESIANAFFVTAGTFGAMSLFGLFTKRDLSTVGRFLYMMLIGLIIATIVNIFLASSVLGWATTFIGVIVFSGLTAYDTQKMKVLLTEFQHTGESNLLKIALLCSLSLYLDFINLFLYMLRIFGDRK